MVVWFVGLSGSGKTTLGREVAKQWRLLEPNTVLLDGDEMRKLFAHDQSEDAYTIAGRRKNAERIAALCELLDKQNINVVCCILSIFPDMRAENPKRFTRYFEVFLDAPLHVLQQRDVKGLYAAAREGRSCNVVGLDIPFEKPRSPNLIIDTSSEGVNIQKLAADILEKVRSN